MIPQKNHPKFSRIDLMRINYQFLKKKKLGEKIKTLINEKSNLRPHKRKGKRYICVCVCVCV